MAKQIDARHYPRSSHRIQITLWLLER